MALRFFRKRQKLIFAIMAILMISFLIGFQGFSMIFSRGRNTRTFGETDRFDIDDNMLAIARTDQMILRSFLLQQRSMMLPWTPLKPYPQEHQQGLRYALRSAGTDETSDSLSFALLLKEAELDGIAVSGDEVGRLIEQMNQVEEFNFEAVALKMRQNDKSMTKDRLHTALAHWLMIHKRYISAAVIVPPSRRRLVTTYRDLAERISLEVLSLSADEFLEKAGQVSDEQIKERFESEKGYPAGVFRGAGEFTFGYRTEALESLAYLYVDREAVGRAVGEQAVEGRFSALQNEALTAVRIKAGGVKPKKDEAGKIYRAVAADFLDEQAGQELLSRKIEVVGMKNTALEDAVKKLAVLADPELKAICFPWGNHDSIEIDPKIKVTVQGTGLTVGEALEKICSQIPEMPKIEWGCCKGFDQVLFPVGGLRVFPVTAGVTGLMTSRQLGEHPLVSKMDGPERMVTVVDSREAVIPDKLTDELRTEVMRDCKIAAAFDLAEKKAREIKTPKDMEKYAEGKKLELVETGLFSRKVMARQSFLAPPRILPGSVPGMDFANRGSHAYFIRKAFELAGPEDPNAYYPEKSGTAAVVPLKAERTVYVIRRVDFRPALEEDFEAQQSNLNTFLCGLQEEEFTGRWFSPAEIMKRTGFKWQDGDDN